MIEQGGAAMPVTKDEIRQLVGLVRDTRAAEIDCDECLVLVGEYAEARLAGLPVAEGMDAVEQHLRICPECREEFEALRQAMSELSRPPSGPAGTPEGEREAP